ncbi:MAG TPA: ABC transporter permease [Candidatus Limnocylindria bacterium]|nr:ABC transporter permease [Candidatus Limnocylindria bacterium]
MRDFRIVFAYEFRTQLTKKTTVTVTAVLMAVMLLVTFLPRILGAFDSGAAGGPGEYARAMDPAAGYAFGGETARAQVLPALSAAESQVYPGRDALVAALRAKDIEIGYVIRDDLSYEAIYLDRSMTDTRDAQMGGLLSSIKRDRAVRDMGLSAERYAEISMLEAQGETTVLGRNSGSNYFLAFGMMLAVYMMVLLYGNGVSTVIAREKDSRTMEVLITSTRPAPLIIGKVAAAGLAALVQFGAVILVTVIGYQLNRASYPAMVAAMLSGTLTTSYVLTFAFFSFFGFVLYLFLFAALGSTVSKMEDLPGATALIQFLFVFAYLLATFAAQMPAGSAAILGSLIPFTSIMVMPIRSGMMTVPWAELLVSGALMLLFVAFFAYLSIKIYRWGTLNYGNKTRLARIVREALRRER